MLLLLKKRNYKNNFFTGIHSKVLDKVVYPGGRIFLPLTHPMRSDSSFRIKDEIRHISDLRRTPAEEKKISTFIDQLQIENRDEG